MPTTATDIYAFAWRAGRDAAAAVIRREPGSPQLNRILEKIGKLKPDLEQNTQKRPGWSRVPPFESEERKT
jgi:hypothetical protein